jgi:hypothetical protein
LLGIQPLQPLRGAQQQRRRVPPSPQRERGMGHHPLHPCGVEIADRPGLCCRQQGLHRHEVARREFRLGRRERPCRAGGRVRGERHGLLPEGGGRGDPAPPLGAVRRADEFLRDGLVRSVGRVRAVPRAAVWIDLRVGRRRQPAMCHPSVAGTGGTVNRGTH